MPGFVILVRNPATDRVFAITEGETELNPNTRLAVFKTENEADEAATKSMLCDAWPYAVVEAP